MKKLIALLLIGLFSSAAMAEEWLFDVYLDKNNKVINMGEIIAHQALLASASM